MTPLVSVIITTVDRAELLRRAVASALAQTIESVEVIVVVDGGGEAVQHTLAAIDDARLRVVVLPERGGQGRAINAGVAAAHGRWAALLDDDDTWMPGKLARQLEAAEASPVAQPIVGCRFVARGECGDEVWPRRQPLAAEPVCEYLFCRRQISFGEGILPTSMIFCPTSLLRAVPMSADLARHCDLDWLIRADVRDDVRVEIAGGFEPLGVWDVAEQRSRMSNEHDWRYSRDWIAARRELVTERAYAGFLLTWVSFSARCQGDAAAFGSLLGEALRRGRPNACELVVHVGTWGLPRGLRALLGRRLSAAASALQGNATKEKVILP